MKKIIFILAVLFVQLCFLPAFAKSQVLSKSVPVEALTAFDSENPVSTFDVKVVGERELADETILKEGYIVFFDVIEVKYPKRLKQNANFKLKAKYYIDTDAVKHEFKHDIFAKYTTILDKKNAVKTVALGVGNYFVKGLSTGVAAVEGAVKNEEGNRAKSSLVSMYKSSPFSYVEKGKPLFLAEGDIFLLKFKIPDYEEADEPNYEYIINKQSQEQEIHSQSVQTDDVLD